MRPLILAVMFACACDPAPAQPNAASSSPSAPSASGPRPAASAPTGFDDKLLEGHPPRSIAGQVLDGSNHPARDAVVWVEGREEVAADAGAAPAATVDQKDKTFLPSVLPIRVGTTVTFKNGDTILHNVYSRAKAKSFDLGTFSNTETKTVTFDAPGQIDVFCAIHTNMHTTILVLETSKFAATDARGVFRIEDVAPGKHNVVVWDRVVGQTSVAVETFGDRAAVVKHVLREGTAP